MSVRAILAGVAFAVTAVIGLAAPSNAAFISGSINLTGDFQPTINGLSTPTQDLSQATGIDFLPLGGGSGATNIVNVATGDLSTFAGQSGTITDLIFSPFSSLSNFFSLTSGGSTLSFDLNTLSVDAQTTNFLNLSGSGVLHLTGFQDTVGTWFLSAQSSGGASPQATFSWSAGSMAVPEPASLALLGVGLMALVLMHLRKERVGMAA